MKDRQIRRLLAPGRAKNWQLLYNAACCYSRLVALGEPEQNEPVTVKAGKRCRCAYCRAMELLDAAFREADGNLDLVWIEHDPDLVAVRDPHLQPHGHAGLTYDSWAKRRRPPPPETPPPPPPKGATIPADESEQAVDRSNGSVQKLAGRRRWWSRR